MRRHQSQPPSSPERGHLRLQAVHADGLLGRLTTMLGPFHITDFHYELQSDGVHVMVDACLIGSEWQLERAASKLRRIIGVLAVETQRGSSAAVGSAG